MLVLPQCNFYFSKSATNVYIFSWAKAPALYVTMSQGVVAGHFLDLAFRAQIELRNVKVKVKLR